MHQQKRGQTEKKLEMAFRKSDRERGSPQVDEEGELQDSSSGPEERVARPDGKRSEFLGGTSPS